MPVGIMGTLAALYWDGEETLYVRRRGEAPFALDLGWRRAISVEIDLSAIILAAEKDEETRRRTWRRWSVPSVADEAEGEAKA